MPAANPPYITVSQGMSGFFAVMVTWNEEGFYEPYNTGIGRYATGVEANVEAKHWAELEGVKYRPAHNTPKESN